LTLAYRGARLGLTLQGYARRIDYEHVGDDYEERGARVGATWQLHGDLRAHVESDYLKRKFLGLDRTDVERDHRIGVSYLLTRNLSLMAEGEYVEDASTAPQASFVNRRTMLVLAYRSGPLYEPKLRD
jgi:hypothetical protein